MDSNITLQTKQMIDSLKAVCTNFGLGNASSEYKIITEVFLYKFLNDKFLFEAKRVEPVLAKLSPADAEKQLAQMTDDDYELFLLGFGPDTAKLKQTHFISYLFNRKNEENFHTVFDDTLLDIATYNIDIFSVRTGGQSNMRLFSGISQHVIEAEKKDDFCRAIIDKIAECSFDSVFEQKYDFFAQIFEYLIKDYNKDFGKYAEYYTPHSIASIIANICLRYYVTSDLLYLLLRFLEHHIGNNNGNEAQYATRRLLDVVLLFDSNEDAEDFATYVHRHLGTFDGKVLEQREPYIANETDTAAKALAQEIRNSQALKEMQPEWEQFRLENA